MGIYKKELRKDGQTSAINRDSNILTEGLSIDHVCGLSSSDF